MVICGIRYNMCAMNLKQLRIKAGLTVRELSAYTQIDYSYLSKLENGTKALTEEMATRLALFFGVDENCVKGKPYYRITVLTSDFKESFGLSEYDLEQFGDCYECSVVNGKIINVLKPSCEKPIIDLRNSTRELMLELKREKEIVDSMDEWAPINLMYAQAKVNKLLEEYEKKKR